MDYPGGYPGQFGQFWTQYTLSEFLSLKELSQFSKNIFTLSGQQHNPKIILNVK